MTDFCKIVKQDYYYFDSELLQSAPNVVLPTLSRWLDLESPLSERYEIFSETGKVGKGDSSALIQSGKIIKATSDYRNIDLPKALLEKAHGTYQECRQQIIKNADKSVTACP